MATKTIIIHKEILKVNAFKINKNIFLITNDTAKTKFIFSIFSVITPEIIPVMIGTINIKQADLKNFFI